MIDIEAIELRVDEAVTWGLMKWAAPIIAGRKCRILKRVPSMIGAAALVSIDQDGLPVVCISPDLGAATIGYFLHEMAHVKLHTDFMIRSNAHEAPAKSEPLEYSTRWEDQADALRDQWLQIGKAHADPDLPEDQGIIFALAIYHLNQRIER